MADNAKQESGTISEDKVTVDSDDSKYAVTSINSESEDENSAGAANFSTQTAADMVEIRIDEPTVNNSAEMPSVMQPTKSSSVINSKSNVHHSANFTSVKLVPLTSPLPSLVSSFRVSAFNAIKRTRQTLSEKIGHGTKTVDVELDARVESLQLLQKRYSNMIQLARSFNTHFSNVVACQQALEAEFNDLSQKMPELHSEFSYNADTQRILFKNGETLIGNHLTYSDGALQTSRSHDGGVFLIRQHAISFFISSLNTLCFKTIEDTLVTVKQYEEARLEYDAYRNEYESNSGNKSPALEQSYQEHRQKFEQTRQILDIKLKLLDENKVKVMHQQLVLFHNAISAYFSGNQTALDDTIKQFSIKLRSPTGAAPSFLENQK